MANPTPYPKGPSSRNVGVTLTSDFSGFETAEQPKPVLVSKTDVHFLQYLDPVTLEPRQITTYSSILPQLNGVFSAAHPGLVGGELCNYNVSFGKDIGEYTFVELPL